MNVRISSLLCLFCTSFFVAPTLAQCRNQQDRPCWSLQYILYAAETDFREFRGSTPLNPSDRKLTPPSPDLSVGAIHVPCHTDFWLRSEAPVYMCSADVPAQEAEEWYAKTMADLRELQYLWQFKSDSPGPDHYVDAGPQGCEVPQVKTATYGTYHVDEPYIVDGPYLGQCPLHLQTVREADGAARISFWLNSSLNLARNPDPTSKFADLSASAETASPQPSATSASASIPAPAPTTSAAAPPGSTTTNKLGADAVRTESAVESAGERTSKRYVDCDDLCQGLKRVLENRASSFRQLGAGRGSSVQSKSVAVEDTVKLSGAGSCSINATPYASTRSSARNELISGARFAPVSARNSKVAASWAAGGPATQYVCYWPQDSEAAAESEFLDLVGLLKTLIPSSWSAEQMIDADELSGAQIKVWSARDARKRAAIRLYMSGRSVGLHISAGK
jgi:hypothetical protein